VVRKSRYSEWQLISSFLKLASLRGFVYLEHGIPLSLVKYKTAGEAIRGLFRPVYRE
jgi:hypothetical protein